MSDDTFAYAFAETADDSVRKILLTIPSRWGRMPPLSRAVVVEAGRKLEQMNLLEMFMPRNRFSPTAGLIGATRWGSHSTDIAFASSMAEDVQFASPAIFGYTLPNIPLAEAANHFGLTGPVYALIETEDPLRAAAHEAQQLLHQQAKLDMMLACEFDAYYDEDDNDTLSVTFTLIKKDDNSYHSLS